MKYTITVDILKHSVEFSIHKRGTPVVVDGVGFKGLEQTLGTIMFIITDHERKEKAT